ncbi:MAG TPA: hypothetical protein VM492_05775 [Sumerlaeia bacterium]|nr:hypothetical protein [Sumerlaeia bacterium]
MRFPPHPDRPEKPAGARSRQRFRAPGLLACLLIGAAGILTACSGLKPVPPLTRRVAVLDFKVPGNVAENSLQVKGWWFGARTVFQNPRAGAIFGDVLSNRLADLEYIEQHSRSDLKYYMARKRGLLGDKFKGFSDEQYNEMLLGVSPVDYGAELGVDYVIAGRIIEAYTSHHRTIHTWYSYASVEVDLWDMATGQVVWTRIFSKKKRFFSQKEAMDRLAPKVVRALDKTYFQLRDR